MPSNNLLVKLIDSAIRTRSWFYVAGLFCIVFGIVVYAYGLIQMDALTQKTSNENIEIVIKDIVELKAKFATPGGIFVAIGFVLMVTGKLSTKKITIDQDGKPKLIIYMSRSYEIDNPKNPDIDKLGRLVKFAVEGKLKRIDSNTFNA